MADYDETIRQLSQLHLAEKSAVQLEKPEPDYVLDIAVQPGEEPLVAAACTNFDIRLLVRNRLTPKATLTGHSGFVTGVAFGKSDSNVLYSCSKDKTIRCWDIRTNSEAQVVKAPASVTGDLLCVDVSHSDKLICAGTEKVGEDALVLFWDTRQYKLLGSYKECHDDDVTQVSFQPGSDGHLASGSTDGLLCTFDLSQTSEDDALQITSNAQSAISKVGWCGDGNSCVYCVTTDNMFYTWDALQGDDFCCIEDLNSLLGDESSVEYLIDCVPELTSSQKDPTSAVLLGGTNSGTIQLIRHSPSSTSVFSSLHQGHSATVRCCKWDPKTGTLLSGGEDSLLCLWSVDQPKAAVEMVSTPTGGKVKAKAKMSSNERKPYKKRKS